MTSCWSSCLWRNLKKGRWSEMVTMGDLLWGGRLFLFLKVIRCGIIFYEVLLLYKEEDNTCGDVMDKEAKFC